MSDAGSKEEVSRSDEGVTVRKFLEPDRFSTPAVAFEFRSDRDDPVLIRLVDPLPEGADLEEVGFHPDYGSQHWTASEEALTFEYRLEPGEEYTTVYGLRAKDIDQFMTTFEFEAANADGDRVGDVSDVISPTDSQPVRDMIAGASTESAEAETGGGSVAAPSDPADALSPAEPDTATDTPERAEAADAAAADVPSEISEPADEPASPEPAPNPEPAEAATADDGIEPIEAGEPVGADESIEAGEPVEADESIEASEPMGADESIEAGAPVEADESIEAGEPVEAEEAPEAAEAVDFTDAVSPAEPQEPADVQERPGREGEEASAGVTDPIDSGRAGAEPSVSAEAPPTPPPDARADSGDEVPDQWIDEGVIASLAGEIRNGDVADEDLDTLADALGGRGSSTESRIRHLQNQVADLAAYRSELEAFIDENGGAQAMLDDLRERMNGVEGVVDDVETGIESVEADLEGVTERIEGHDERLERLDEDVDRVDNHLGRIDGDVDRLDGSIDSVADDVEGLAGDVGSLDRSLDELDGVVGSIADDVDRIDDDVGALRRELERLGDEVTARLDEEIADVGATVDRLEEDLAAINRWRDRFRTVLAADDPPTDDAGSEPAIGPPDEASTDGE